MVTLSNAGYKRGLFRWSEERRQYDERPRRREGRAKRGRSLVGKRKRERRKEGRKEERKKDGLPGRDTTWGMKRGRGRARQTLGPS